MLASHKNGMPKDPLNHLHLGVSKIPFDSDHKLVMIVKGAFDVMDSRWISGHLQAVKQINM